LARVIVNAAGEEEHDRLSPRANLLEAGALFALIQLGLWGLPRSAGDPLLALVASYLLIGARLVHRDGSESWGLPRPFALFACYRTLDRRGRGWLLAALAGLGLWATLSMLPVWPYLLQRVGVRRHWPVSYTQLANEPLLALLLGPVVFAALALFLIRWDRWRFTPRLFAWGAVLWAGVLALAVATGHGGRLARLAEPSVASQVFFYGLWAMLQQYCVLGYFNGRIRKGFAPGRRLLVALVCGSIFAWLHVPAWSLVAATLPVGVLFAWFFQVDRSRNLFVLGLVHGVAGTLYAVLLPYPMTIGPWGY
jgi:hypothetical protein